MPDTYAAFHEIVAEDQELTPLRLEMLLLLLPEFTTSFHEGHVHRFFSLPPSPLRQRLLAAILEQNSMITRVSLQEYDNLVARGDKAALALLLKHDWKHKYSDLAHPFNLLQNTRPSPLRTEILQIFCAGKEMPISSLRVWLFSKWRAWVRKHSVCCAEIETQRP